MMYELEEKDILESIAFWKSLDGVGLNEVDDSFSGVQKFIDRNPGLCFIYRDPDKSIVGTILSGHDGRRGTIYHLAVHPDYRNEGIGTQLVNRVIENMIKEDILKLNLVVFHTNEKGNAFWEKLGFTVRNDLVYRDKVIIDNYHIIE